MSYEIYAENLTAFANGPEELESILSKLSVVGYPSFRIERKLLFNLSAIVSRRNTPEEIILDKNGVIVTVTRETGTSDGPFGASCRESGDEVLVESINIDFRNYYDSFTDRGIVWVSPGKPAQLAFVINTKALKIPRLVADIAAEAENAVNEKLLRLF